MPTPPLFEGAISVLQKSLNQASLRHSVITSNIANIDTPNYKAFEVVMEDVRQKKGGFSGTLQLVRTEPRHLNGRRQASDQVKIKASQPVPFNLRADGNTVDYGSRVEEGTVLANIDPALAEAGGATLYYRLESVDLLGGGTSHGYAGLVSQLYRQRAEGPPPADPKTGWSAHGDCTIVADTSPMPQK